MLIKGESIWLNTVFIADLKYRKMRNIVFIVEIEA